VSEAITANPGEEIARMDPPESCERELERKKGVERRGESQFDRSQGRGRLLSWG